MGSDDVDNGSVTGGVCSAAKNHCGGGTYANALALFAKYSDSIDITSVVFQLGCKRDLRQAELCSGCRSDLSGITVRRKLTEQKEVVLSYFFCAFCERVGCGKEHNILPFTVMATESKDYTTYSGKQIRAEDCDFVVRLIHGPGEMFGEGVMHKALPGTVSVATAVCSLLPGSILNQISRADPASGVVRIGHPSGRIVVRASVSTEPEFRVEKAIFSRTVRPIMDGYVMVPESFYISEIEK